MYENFKNYKFKKENNLWDNLFTTHAFLAKSILITGLVLLTPAVFVYNLLSLIKKENRDEYIKASLNLAIILKNFNSPENKKSMLEYGVLRFPKIFGFLAPNIYCSLVLKLLKRNDDNLQILLKKDKGAILKNLITWYLTISDKPEHIKDEANSVFDLMVKNFEKYASTGFFDDIRFDFLVTSLRAGFTKSFDTGPHGYNITGYSAIYGRLSLLSSVYGESFAKGIIASGSLKENDSSYLIDHISRYSYWEMNKYHLSGVGEFRDEAPLHLNHRKKSEFADSFFKVCLKEWPGLEKAILIEALTANNINLLCNAKHLGVDLNQKIIKGKSILDLSLSKNKKVLSRYLAGLGANLDGRAVGARKSNLEKIKKMLPENKIKQCNKLNSNIEKADLENMMKEPGMIKNVASSARGDLNLNEESVANKRKRL